MPSNTQKTIKGLSSQSIVTIVLGIVEVVSFSLMSRLLTKEDFGIFAVVSAVVTIFSSISEAGLGASLVQRKSLNKSFVDNVFSLSMIMGVALMLLLILSSGLISSLILGNEIRLALILMSISLPVHSLSSVNLSLLQRDYKFITIGVIRVTSVVVSTVIAVILAIHSYGYYSIIAKAVSAPCILYLLSLIYARRKYSFQLNKEYIKEIVNFSGWFMASRLLRNLSKQLDKLLMPRLIDVETLGAYSRPKDFIEQFSGKINGIFDTALFPVLSSIQDDNARLKSSLSKSLYFLNLFSTFLALAFIFNSRLIIRVFFGSEWINLVPLFIILSIAIVFNVDGRLADCYFRSLGRTKQQFFFRVGEVASKIVGVVIGAYFGVIGIAIGVVLSESILRVGKLLYISSTIGVKVKVIFTWLFSSWRPMLFIVPLCSLTFILSPNSLWGDIITMIAFIITCLIPLVLFPTIIGGNYKAELYPKVICQIKQHLHFTK